MSLIPKENLSNLYSCFHSLFDEFVLRRWETICFGTLGFSRDYRHKIRPLNSERREIWAVGSDLTVVSGAHHKYRSDRRTYSPLASTSSSSSPRLNPSALPCKLAVDAALAASLPEGRRRRIPRRRALQPRRCSALTLPS